jgi:predicted enzyme related to lactoylglutathione lyase
MIFVHDVERAAKWYVDTFAFMIRFVAGPHYGILFHEGMKFRLDLHPSKAGSGDVGHGPQAYFVSDDLDAEVKSLRAKGIEVADPRSESGSPRFCNFKDCEGNVLGLMERRG